MSLMVLMVVEMLREELDTEVDSWWAGPTQDSRTGSSTRPWYSPNTTVRQNTCRHHKVSICSDCLAETNCTCSTKVQQVWYIVHLQIITQVKTSY